MITGENRVAKRKCVEKSSNNMRRKRECEVGSARSVGYLLSKVFRKDGPPVGVEFDSLPSHAFQLCKRKGSRKSHRACQEYQRALKRRKISEPTMLENQTNQDSAPLPKHGMGKGLMTAWRFCNQAPVNGIGKGLMTLWRLANPNCGDPPVGSDCDERAITDSPPLIAPKQPVQNRKKSRRQPIKRRTVTKLQDKKKPATRNRKVRSEPSENRQILQRGKCELALEAGSVRENLNLFADLVDDEELELRELSNESNPLTFCGHFANNGFHGCSLCKDLLLAKFPPSSVTMKQPLRMQPWGSSPELVKKLFKVFHFVCTYAVTIGFYPFTFEEFAQAFCDKDSMLLGKVNVALLNLLLSDVDTELSSEILSHVSKNCKYRGLLQSVTDQGLLLQMWKKSVNSLTWVEILRQVLVAAGFGSKHSTSPTRPLSKEASLMEKYGLHPCTLKGELFIILSLQGNMGSKISELAKSPSIAELKLTATSEELELLISSMLSSDITLFEKISSSAYRLRMNTTMMDSDDQSDLEDLRDYTKDSSDDSEDDFGTTTASKRGQKDHNKYKDNMLTVYTEIDESNPGEAWLIGLMEGEYSDLSVDEKLSSLLALIDLVSAGSSIRMEEPVTSITQYAPNIGNGSGAKIKRSSAKQHTEPIEANTRPDLQPVDSSVPISKSQGKNSSIAGNNAKESENMDGLHPMQSIFLGSDRRYNKYWIFLGPCNGYDTGHKRIYFESSEDGHWEVIETQEALCTLLSVLDRRGRRESQLFSSLEKREALLSRAMSSVFNDSSIRQPAQSNVSDQSVSRDDSSSAVSDVDNLLGLTPASTAPVITQVENRELQRQKLSRMQAFDAWIWSSFYSELNAVKHGKRSYIDSLARCESCHDLYWRDEKHCKVCHTTFEIDFDLEERYAIHAASCRGSSDHNTSPKHKVLSSQLQSLKAAIYAIESSMPEGAMLASWTKSTHNLWVNRLRRTSTHRELLQVLSDFVGGVNEEWLHKCNFVSESKISVEEIIATFQTMTQTSSAIALWLVNLDALVAPRLRGVNVDQRLTTRSKGMRAATH